MPLRRTLPTRDTNRGFTLVELLVAMVVMAIMSLMAWQGVDGIVRTRQTNQVRLEQTLRLETVMAQWEQDIASLQQTTAVPAISCDGRSVRLTRRTDDGMQLVVWSLQPDAQGNVWQRWAGPPVTTTSGLQETWYRSMQFQGNEPGQLRTLAGLESWQVYFFQGAWANCQSSRDAPVAPTPSSSAPIGGTTLAPTVPVVPTVPSAAPGVAIPAAQTLPAGIRVVLGFAPGSGLVGNLTRDSLIAP